MISFQTYKEFFYVGKNQTLYFSSLFTNSKISHKGSRNRKTGSKIFWGTYQLVTVGYESCEKIFKKLGFRIENLTGFSHDFTNLIKKFAVTLSPTLPRQSKPIKNRILTALKPHILRVFDKKTRFYAFKNVHLTALKRVLLIENGQKNGMFFGNCVLTLLKPHIVTRYNRTF